MVLYLSDIVLLLIVAAASSGITYIATRMYCDSKPTGRIEEKAQSESSQVQKEIEIACANCSTTFQARNPKFRPASISCPRCGNVNRVA